MCNTAHYFGGDSERKSGTEGKKFPVSWESRTSPKQGSASPAYQVPTWGPADAQHAYLLNATGQALGSPKDSLHLNFHLLSKTWPKLYEVWRMRVVCTAKDTSQPTWAGLNGATATVTQVSQSDSTWIATVCRSDTPPPTTHTAFTEQLLLFSSLFFECTTAVQTRCGLKEHGKHAAASGLLCIKAENTDYLRQKEKNHTKIALAPSAPHQHPTPT